MSNYQVTVGKVRRYDGVSGEIVTNEETYMFTPESIQEGTLNENDLVMFRGEEIHNTKKAYFIQKLDNEKSIDEQVYKRLIKAKENE